MKAAMKDHHVSGKDQMKQCASGIARMSIRKGGFSPSQCVLAKVLRRPDSLAEEHEWSQLGLLAPQQGGMTDFFKARFRMSMQEAFAAMLGEVKLSDNKVVGRCFRNVLDSSERTSTKRRVVGPARVVGFLILT